MNATVTPGQAAYEAMHASRMARDSDDGGAFVPFGELDECWTDGRGLRREDMEAAARAAIEAAPSAIIRFDGKLSETDVAELREKFAEAVRTARPSVLAEPVTEGNGLRALAEEIISKASILTAYDDTGELSALIDHLAQRAGIVPAAVTAGTEHLAGRIRRLTIPDEEN